MKILLVILALFSMFMMAMAPARASPLDTAFDAAARSNVPDVLSEDFDRMPAATFDLVQNEQPHRMPVGHGAVSSLTDGPNGSEVAPCGVGIGS